MKRRSSGATTRRKTGFEAIPVGHHRFRGGCDELFTPTPKHLCLSSGNLASTPHGQGGPVAPFVTRPTDTATLDAFYRHVRPGGPGWRPVAARHADVQPDTGLGALALNWIAGVVLVYSALFGTGYFLYGQTQLAMISFAVLAVAAMGLFRTLPRVGFLK